MRTVYDQDSPYKLHMRNIQITADSNTRTYTNKHGSSLVIYTVFRKNTHS